MSELPPALDTRATASVFDFLYFDSKRAASLQAQLTGNGSLQGLKRSTSTARTARHDMQMQGKVGIRIVEAGSGHTDSSGEEERDSLERLYDPLWSNAVDVLDLLDGAGLVHRQLETAAIGHCVLVTGSLVMMDLSLLREIWKRPAMRKLMAHLAGTHEAQDALNRHDRRTQAKKKSADGPPTEGELLADLIDLLPHALQGYIISPGAEVFFTMQSEHLLTPAGDLMLKHGSHLGREWNVVGIVDAIPGAMDDGDIADLVRAGTGSQLSQIVTKLGFPVREMMGRPTTAYAMTPLAVFRGLRSEPSPQQS